MTLIQWDYDVLTKEPIKATLVTTGFKSYQLGACKSFATQPIGNNNNNNKVHIVSSCIDGGA